MRKFYLRLLAIPLLLGAQLAQAQVPCSEYYEDFEGGALPVDFVPGAGTYTRAVTTNAPAEGNYCFEHTGSSGFYTGTSVNFPAQQPDSLSWYIKTNNTTGANGYFVIGDANLTNDNGILFVYCNSTSGLRFYAQTGYNHPIQANTWYHVQVRDIDWVNRNMDIYVNGALILTNWPFRSTTATSMDRIHFHNLSAATASYDRIMVGKAGLRIDSSMVQDAFCFGDSTGSIDLTLSGANGVPSYMWSTGDTTEDLNALPAGTYTFTATDSLGCAVTDSFTVNSNPEIVASGTTIDPLCPGQPAGSVDLTVTGGTPGFNYAWTNGDTTQDLFGLPGGTYTVVVTDSFGCSVTDSFTITEPAAWMVSGNVSQVACFGDSTGAIDLTVSGATPNYDFSWANGPMTEDISGLTGGTYTVLITDSLGCIYIDSFMVAAPTAPLAGTGIVSDDTSGMGTGAVDFTANGGTPPYTFAWSNAATTEDLSGLSAGTYIVTVTDSNGCVYTDTFIVDLFVSVSQGLGDASVSVWPNPSNGEFQLRYSGFGAELLQVTLTDLTGRSLWRQELVSATEGQLSLRPEVAAGTYLLLVRSGEQQQTLRITIR